MINKLGFVEHFRSEECAILALSLILEKQNAGLKYIEILYYPGFLGLFSPNFLFSKTSEQLVIKLKNVVRDFRDSTISLPSNLETLRLSFRLKKRGSNISKRPVRLENTELSSNKISEDIKEAQRLLLAEEYKQILREGI